MDELEAAAAVLAMDIDSDADLDSELEASLTIPEVIFHRQALRSQLQWTRWTRSTFQQAEKSGQRTARYQWTL